MKKLLPIITVCFLTTASLFAQGRVNFSNTSATPIQITSSWYDSNGTFHEGPTNVLGTASTATFGIGPASVRIQLFAGLTSTSLIPVMIGSAVNQSFVTNSASTVAGAQGTFNGGANLPLSGFAGGAPVFLQAVVEAILGTYYGRTPIIQVNLATGSDPATPLFSPTPTANQWDGVLIGFLELYPAPEPSALTLFGLGSFLMFAARRK